MKEFEIIDLFGAMKKVFNCENLKLNIYNDPSSSVNLVLSKSIDDFIHREERKTIACIFGDEIKLNLFVAQKVPYELVEEILIHEITHYLLSPKVTSGYPRFLGMNFMLIGKYGKRKKENINVIKRKSIKIFRCKISGSVHK